MTDAALLITSSIPDEPSPSSFHDAAFTAELRRQMLRFAHLQLQDTTLAEDAVQEALLGAMTAAKRFSGRAAHKTWVFVILKHKIADILRQRHKMVAASCLLRGGEDESLDAVFDERGHWLADSRPTGWNDPEASLGQRQFWAVFEACLDGIPAAQARVFMMREFMELETTEICTAVGVSQANVFVMLHRSRMRLRECLDQRWFASASA